MPQSLDSFDNDYYIGNMPRLEQDPPIAAKYSYPGVPGDAPFGGEKYRGSSQLPLTPNGLMKAHTLAMKLAQKGGLDRIMTSDLDRTVKTAHIISHYTHAPVVAMTNKLGPWHLGGLEGQPVNEENSAFLNYLISEEPDLKLPGRGPLSTADGESFDDFRKRTIPFLQKVIGESRARPQEKTGLVTHYRVVKLLSAWMRNGMPDDGSVDSGEMTLHDTKSAPGSMERLYVDPFAGPQMSSVDLDTPAHLQGGIYIIRHEDTPWNKKPQGFGTNPQ